MWSLRLRRWRWLRRSSPAAVLVDAWKAPLPSMGDPIESVDFLVCDAEMSSLDPTTGELLSLGWVRIRGGEIVLGTARHRLIRNRDSVGQSAVIHKLRDCELKDAGGLEGALVDLVEAAAGAVLVFHNAALDMAFLNRAAKETFQAPILLPVADTLLLEQRLMTRRDQTPGHGSLRLQACRDRYGLISHDAHNALADAMATAELLLAHMAGRGPGLRLRDLL